MQSSGKKFKIAWFSPLPPIKAGPAMDNEFLIPELAKKAVIDIFIDDNYKPNSKKIRRLCKIYSYKKFDKMKKVKNYDVIIYQIGNSPYHVYMLDVIKKNNGIIVLHDFVLNGLMWNKFIPRNNKLGFFYEILKNEGFVRLLKYFRDNGVDGDLLKSRAEEYSLSKDLINNSKAVICTNKYVKSKVKNVNPDLKVKVIRLGVPSKKVDKNIARNKLGLPSDKIIISSQGFMIKNKRVPFILRTFKEFLKRYPNSLYCIVGKIADDEIKKSVKKLSLSKNVRLTGFVDDAEFFNYINASDFCINLRYPTMGESSGVVLASMKHGKATIISNHKQYREFPDNCCLKIHPSSNEQALLEKMFFLTENKDIAQLIGENAEELAKDFSWSKSAGDYIDFIKEVIK